MSNLSFWNILLLKDEINLETYIFIEWVVPCVLVGVIILGILNQALLQRSVRRKEND